MSKGNITRKNLHETDTVKAAKLNVWGTIIVAIITGLVSITVTLLTIHQDKLDHNELKQASDRVDRFFGTWRGEYEQDPVGNGEAITGNMVLEFFKNPNVVEGKGCMDHKTVDEKIILHFSFSGQYLHGDHIRIETNSEDNSKIQFGSIIAKLHTNGIKLEGQYVGFGAQTQQIVHGTIDLKGPTNDTNDCGEN